MMHASIVRFGVLLAVVIGALATPACSSDSAGILQLDDSATGPQAAGENPFNSDEVGCSTGDDCGPGESCFEGVCMIDTCPPDYPTAPPMGTIFKFYADDELLFLSGTRASGYQAIDKGFRPEGGDINVPSGTVDVAGGPVLTHRPNSLVVVNGTNEVRLITKGQEDQVLPLDFAATRVEAGDIDGDGYFEVLVAGPDGAAVCDPKEGKDCVNIPLGEEPEGVDAVPDELTVQKTIIDEGTPADESDEVVTRLNDITIGDVDGDGIDEALMVGSADLHIYNHFLGRSVRFKNEGGSHISAGDVDEDGADELMIAKASGVVDVFKVQTSGLDAFFSISADDIPGGIKDIAAMDMDDNLSADLVVLTGTDATIFRGNAAGLDKWYSAPLSTGTSFQRLAIMDVDGDSAIATYQYGPEVFNGPIVPQTVMIFPPYWNSFSSEGDAFVGWGVAETEKVTQTESLSVDTKMTIGLEARLGVPFVSALVGSPKVMAGMMQTTKASAKRGFTVETRRYIRHQLFPDPATQGVDNGGVVVTTSCYAYYEYKLSDPFKKVGEVESDIMPMVQPIDTASTVMSVKRYNAIAEFAGIPEINIPYRTGDPSTYPTDYVDLAGDPINPEDFVFEPREYDTNDATLINWRLSLQTATTEEHSVSTGIGAVLEVKDINPFAGAAGAAKLGGSFLKGVGKGGAKVGGKFLTKTGIAGAARAVGSRLANLLPRQVSKKLSRSGSSAAAKEAGKTGTKTSLSSAGKTALMSPSSPIGVGAVAASLLGAKGVFKYETKSTRGVSYKMTYGERTLFYGIVPNIRDRPDTPEDETTVYGYRFSPFVYRHYYEDPLGEIETVNVISYTVKLKGDGAR